MWRLSSARTVPVEVIPIWTPPLKRSLSVMRVRA